VSRLLSIDGLLSSQGARRFISCALGLVQIYLTVSTSAGGENGPSS